MISRKRIRDKKRRIRRLQRIFVDNEFTFKEDITTDLYGRQCSCWMCSYGKYRQFRHIEKKRIRQEIEDQLKAA